MKVTRRQFLTGTANVAIIGASLALCGPHGEAKAYVDDGGINVREKPHTWYQHQKGGKYHDISLGASSGQTMAQAGCAQFSATCMFRKTGIKDSKYDPSDFNREARKSGGISSGGLMQWGGVASMTGKLKLVESKVNRHLSGKNQKDVDGLIKTLMQDYFVLIGVQTVRRGGTVRNDGHWVFADYVDGDYIYILDSSRAPKTLRESYKTVCSVVVYEFPGKKPKDFKNLWQGGGAGLGTPKGSSAPTKEDKAAAIRLEKDLEGMRNDYDMSQDYVQVELPDVEWATQEEEIAMGKVIDDYEAMQEKDPVGRFFKTAFTTLGGVTLFWSVFMVGAIIFDKSNSFLNFSTFKLATFGQRHLKEDEHDTTKGSATILKALGVVALAFIIGILLITGVLFDWMWALWNEINKIYERYM